MENGIFKWSLIGASGIAQSSIVPAILAQANTSIASVVSSSLERAASLAPYWEDALHSLQGLPHVIDIRNLGLVGGIELESRAGAPGARAFEVFVDGFNRGILARVTGDIIALSPPLIIEKSQIDELIGTIGAAIKAIA